MKVTSISPVIGAEVTDVNLKEDISNRDIDVLKKSLMLNKVLAFKDQNLETEEHITFSKRFGPLMGAPGNDAYQKSVWKYCHPDHPEIYRATNMVKSGSTATTPGQPLGRPRAGSYWHGDMTFRENPPWTCILNAIIIPALGGDTAFANMQLAYEDLSSGFKEMLGTLKVVHDFKYIAADHYPPETVDHDDFCDFNRTVQPLVRTIPETGDKTLFINPGNVSHIDGWTPEESKPLLNYLYQHCTQLAYMYRHKWQVGDLVMWDNRQTMHTAITDYENEDRYMERTTVIGEHPV